MGCPESMEDPGRRARGASLGTGGPLVTQRRVHRGHLDQLGTLDPRAGTDLPAYWGSRGRWGPRVIREENVLTVHPGLREARVCQAETGWTESQETGDPQEGGDCLEILGRTVHRGCQDPWDPWESLEVLA